MDAVTVEAGHQPVYQSGHAKEVDRSIQRWPRWLGVVATFGLLVACGGAAPDGTQTAQTSVQDTRQNSGKDTSQATTLGFMHLPTIERLPNEALTLIHFTTNRPVTVQYALGDRWSHQTVEFMQTHYQPLPVLLPMDASQHTLRITASDRSGRRAEQVMQLPRPFVALRREMKPPNVSWSDESQHPPYSLVSFARYDTTTQNGNGSVALDPGYGLLQVFDRHGNPIWHYRHDEIINQVVRTGPASLTLLTANGLVAIDLLGSPLGWVGGRGQQMPKLGVDKGVLVGSQIASVERLQRKVLPLSDGNFLILADVDSMTPALLEANPAGRVIARWDLASLLEGQLGANESSPQRLTPADFAHDPATGTIVLTLPDQRLLLGLHRDKPDIQWLYTARRDLSPQLQTKVLTPVEEIASDADVPQAARSMGFTANGDLVLLNASGQGQGQEQSTKPSRDVESVELVRLRIDPAIRSYQVIRHRLDDQTAGGNVQIAKQHGVQGIAPDVFWLLDRAGQVLSGIDLKAQQSEKTTLLTLEAAAETPRGSWAITDAVALDHWFGSSDYAIAARRAGLGSHSRDVVGTTAQSKTSLFHGLSLEPDLTVEGIDISGDWEITVGDAGLAPTQVLTLRQDQVVVSGDLGNQPITGVIRGNTFSTTYRSGRGDGQVKFKYRGLVDTNESYMEGQVGVYQNAQRLDVAAWQARKR